MDPRITLVTIGVRDLARELAFYRDGLGWPLSSMSQDNVAFFRTSGTILALYPWDLLAEDATVPSEGTGFRGVALAHNVTSREDVDLVLALAASAGGTIVKPAHDVFWGGYSGYFADPEGFLWEVAWGPDFQYGPDGSLLLPA